MERNTLVLITGVLLFGGLFGLTATATATDTAGPTDFGFNVSVDPAEENTTNNFTLSANVSQTTNTSNVTELLVSTDPGVVNMTEDLLNIESNVTFDDGTSPGIDFLQSGGDTNLLLNLTNNFTLANVNGTDVSLDNLSVLANGTFNITLEFLNSSRSTIASHTSTFDIAPEQTTANMSLWFPDQDPNNGMVSVYNVTSDGVNATVLITYDNGSDDIVVGSTNGTFADDTVQVSLTNGDGFPGNHTAHIVKTSNLSSNTSSTDVVSNATASAVKDSQQAYISVDIGNDGSVARDVLGNGLLEDVNGDRALNILDVQALFSNLGGQSFANYPGLFDFSGSGDAEVDIFDVQALYAIS